jgi:hypothetical protein
MNPSLSRIVSVVPDRTARLQSGTFFGLPDAGSASAAQIGFLAGFLSWLTPLNTISEDEQRMLGVGPHARVARHDDDEEVDAEHDDAGPNSAGVEQALRR